MDREIRKVRDLGNGSGVTIPKETLRDWGYVTEDGELADGHLAVSRDGSRITVEPVR